MGCILFDTVLKSVLESTGLAAWSGNMPLERSELAQVELRVSQLLGVVWTSLKARTFHGRPTGGVVAGVVCTSLLGPVLPDLSGEGTRVDSSPSTGLGSGASAGNRIF